MELKHYFKFIMKKLWLIALIVMIACVATGIRSYYMITPIYTATVKLIVNQSSENDELVMPDIDKIQTNIMLINSYKEIVKSPAIADKVVEQFPDLTTNAQELSARISAAALSASQIMTLSYTDISYERAARNVNAISHVFKEQISMIMNVDNITILSEANVNDRAVPINMNPQMDILISLFVSLMFAIGLVFFLDYMDKSYKSEAELEADLGLPVLASVMKIKHVRRKQPPVATNNRAGEETYAAFKQ